MIDENKIVVWWIDDDHNNSSGPREFERNALEEEADHNLKLIPIHPAVFEEHVARLSTESVPDLLLIDFILNTKQHTSKATPLYARDGVALRGMTDGIYELRDIPAYLVSRVTRKAQTGISDDHFDWILSHDQLVGGRGGKLLWEDACAYRTLRRLAELTPHTTDINQLQEFLYPAICDQLRVPAESLHTIEDLVRQTIRYILVKEKKLNSEEMKLVPSRVRAIARWVRATLHRFRGPLVDDLAVATMLGTKLEYFLTELKTKLALEPVKYSGVFQKTASMTVWRQAFLQLLLSQHKTIQLSSLTTLAQSSVETFKVPETGQSVCRVCNKRWPEAIAYDEDDPSVEEAVHWQCSKEALDVDSILGFEVARYF